MSEIEKQGRQVEETISEEPETDKLEALGEQLLPLASYAGEIPEAVIAGHICLEITPTLMESVLNMSPGSVLEAGKAVLSTGGPVSNIGLALHTLGMPTRLMGKIGNDLFGQAIFQLLSAYGTNLTRGMIIAVDESSSYSILLKPAESDRVVVHAPGCNATFSAEDVAYELLESTGLFHFGYPPLMMRMYEGHGQELANMFQRVKGLSVTTSLDLSFSNPGSSASQADWQGILSTTLPSVDIFLAGIEELLSLLRRPVYEKLSTKAGKGDLVERITPDLVSSLGRMLLEMGAKIVGIKMGKRGIYLCSGEIDRLTTMGRAQPTRLLPWDKRELWAPCFLTEVVNEVGVGDAMTAGFLMGILRGMAPEATLASACAVGASSMEGEDVLSGLRSWPETMERIAAGWSRVLPDKKARKQTAALDMQAYQWDWDEEQELWIGPHDSSSASRL
jgi:sugar/nucleoside kinase (ribokinase family)